MYWKLSALMVNTVLGQKCPSLCMLYIFEQALTLTDSTWNQTLDKGDFRVCGLPEAPKTFIY